MSIYRQYRMTSQEGAVSGLEAAPAVSAGKVRTLPGGEGVELPAIIGDGGGFVFTGQWASMEDHKHGGEPLEPGAFVPTGALSAGRPDSACLEARDLARPC